jgi:apolipoprotein N-acyltransferase
MWQRSAPSPSAAGVGRLRLRSSPPAATSIATDQYGRLLGSRGADNVGDGVMIVTVPAQRVPTLYTRIGEVLPLLALLFCVLAISRALRRTARA